MTATVPSKSTFKDFVSVQVIVSWALFVVPFIVFAGYVIRYSINVPYWDDYGLILNFMNNFIQAASIKERLWQIFLPHNEHRMVFEKSIFVLQYALLGKINFQVLNYLGNLGWLLSVAFVAYLWKDKKQPSAIDILPIPYLMLSFIVNENMFFASASLPFFWSVLFSVLFCYFLARSAFLPAGLTLLLALFTSGGGVVLVPLAWLYLLYKRRYRVLAGFALYSLLLLGIYFFSYGLAQRTGGVFEPANLPRYLRYFFTFLGAPMELLSWISGLAFFAGVFGVTWMAFLWFKNRQDEFTWLTIGFVVLIAAEAAALRSSLGLEQALASRYTQYSLLFWCGLLVLSVRAWFSRSNLLQVFFAALAILSFWAVIVVNGQYGTFEKQAVQKSASVRVFQTGNSQFLLHSEEWFARQNLITARKLGVFDYQALDVPLRAPVRYQPSASLQGDRPELKIEQCDLYRIAGWAFIPGLNAGNSQVVVLLDNGTELYQLKTYRTLPRDFTGQDGSGFDGLPGFETYPLDYSVPSGRYKVGILVMNGDQQALEWLDEIITTP